MFDCVKEKFGINSMNYNNGSLIPSTDTLWQPVTSNYKTFNIPFSCIKKFVEKTKS